MNERTGTDRKRFRWPHEMLTDRGWRLETLDADHVDDQGYPTGLQPSWWYPGSFATGVLQPIEEIAPEPLHCAYTLDAADEIIDLLMVSVGNEFACARHAKTERKLPLDTLPEVLPGQLDQMERHARDTDARELIECRFFGLCGTAWDTLGNFR